MLDLISKFRRDQRGAIYAQVATTVAIVGAVSFGAAYYIAERSDQDKRALAELAGLVSREAPTTRSGARGGDQTVTGSLSRAASETRIDPCAIEKRR